MQLFSVFLFCSVVILSKITDNHFGGLAVWDLSYDNAINFYFSKIHIFDISVL
jgi:hypothetical protein